ncbi:MAG TPA: Uma2 family endonuclease [Blastocatellia bacterium]|nr:Uma2 family endonuclease [Blastocatellia bacterium]
MNAIPKHRYTLEEYIELDKNSEERYEYFDGEVFAMAGGTINHGRISSNVHFALRQRLAGKGCEAFTAETRIRVPAALPYRYPDVSVVCGPVKIEEIQGQEMLVNPVLLVEVLSTSTAAYDHGDKFSAYQSIESFREYLLISQERPHVVQYVRQPDNRWLRAEVSGLNGILTLESLDLTLPLSEIYEQVDFPSSGSESATGPAD